MCVQAHWLSARDVSCYFGAVKISATLVLALLASPLAAGTYPKADVLPLACAPPEGNARVDIRVDPLPEGLTPEAVDARVYFRRGADVVLQQANRSGLLAQGHGNFYYVPMYPWADEFDPQIAMPEPGSWSHWGVLPRPENENRVVEYYVSIHDLDGQVLYQSPVQYAPITDDCEVELNADQSDFADNLVIGETVADQEGKRVIWWECEGLNVRIDVELDRRDDRSCFLLIPWWASSSVLVPAASIGGVGVVTIIDDSPPLPEASPSAP